MTELSDYLTSLGSRSATPGGGAAAALTGAQAAALLQMVANLTRGKRFSDIAGEIEALGQSAQSAVTGFLSDFEQDQVAFERVMTLYKEPPCASRDQLMQQALKAAAAAPLSMVNRTEALTATAMRLAQIGNPNLITDVGVGIHLLKATFESARLNVRINLNNIQDDQFVMRSEAAMSSCEQAIRDMLPSLELVRQAMEKNS